MSTALRSQEDLQALAASGADRLGWDAPTSEVIGWVAENFARPAVAVACSMADAVLPALGRSADATEHTRHGDARRWLSRGR